MGRNWLLLAANQIPVDPCKKWMSHESLMPRHPETSLRLQLQELVDQGLELIVLQRIWPLELAPQNFVEDDHLGTANEWRLATSHLE